MEKNLKITDAERLILANQYTILAKLDRAGGGHEAGDYEKLAQWLKDGHEPLYQSHFVRVMADVLPAAVSENVYDILQLFSVLKDSFAGLSPIEQAQINEADIKFIGFDGNNEADYLSLARAAYDAGYFTNLLTGGCPNSHCQMRENYLSMVAAWKLQGRPRGRLTLDKIKDIAVARYVR